MGGEGWTVNSDTSLANFFKHASKLYDKHKFVMFSWTTGRQRTAIQNSSIHVFCREIAEKLNNAGFETSVRSKALKGEIEVPWTQISVKELIWRPVQMKLFPHKDSTVKLQRTEVSEVAEVITRYLGDRFNLHVAFPDRNAAGNGKDMAAIGRKRRC